MKLMIDIPEYLYEGTERRDGTLEMEYVCDLLLKAVDNGTPLEQESCEDCIRRSDIGLTDFEIVMCNGDYKEALKMLLGKIEKAPSVTPVEKVGHWIPVSEGLPEIHNYMQEYIVTIKWNFIRTAFFTETNGKSWWSIDDVIAWMPLPEPYKASPTGAEEENE